LALRKHLIDAGAQVDRNYDDSFMVGEPLEAIEKFDNPELVLLLLKNGASDVAKLKAFAKLLMF